MSKIRIYELAKELGVDNKIVISKAVELGFPGKISHSNSLDGDEADQIRRAVIRQAVGASPAVQQNQQSEVVTQRVDKVTGETNIVVERRTGNVIRRRRSEGADAEPAQVAASESRAGNVIEMRPSGASTSAMQEIFETAVEAPTAPELDDVSEQNGNHAHATEASEEVLAESVEASPEEAEVVEESEVEVAEELVAAEAVPQAPGVEVKRTPGPRVLGRIELPVRRIIKPEVKRPITGNAVAAPKVFTDDAEDEDGAKKGKVGVKKKGRKREFTRGDLVDYEGRDGRRTPRAKASQKRDFSDKNDPNSEAAKTRASKRVVKVHETITVGDLARQMSLKVGEVISKLIELGIMATINQAIDRDTATIISEEFGYSVESTEFNENVILDDLIAEADLGNQLPRPPIVTVMGHVDHGKTSLLDMIRKTSVATREHGGITQHIGAYRVVLDDQRTLTFIDTPGHAAFTQMRSRGAKVTDIVVLVVAADDGVMPQTVEAINHAKAAGVPIIVAVNKMDKGGVNPDRVKQQLVEHGLQPEDWGGDTMFFGVSALKGTGITELLEGLLITAEMKELKANPDRRAKGTIIEARQDKGRGTVATVLVQQGTLRVGDLFVSGAVYGRVRSMNDEQATRLESAGPSVPVEITGLNDVPDAGDDFFVVESEAKAREVSSNRQDKKMLQLERSLATGPISLEEFARRANNMQLAELGVIVKADVHGSVEAVRQSIEQLSTPKVRVRVLHAAVGGVTESDIQLAIASQAIIVGFNVRAEARAQGEADRLGVQIRFYRVIYELIDDVKLAMAGLLAPIKKEIPLGRAEVRDTFTVSKVGTIAGSYVVDGLVRRNAHVRLLRDSRVIHEGKMSSLKRFKDDAREVATGFECGIGIENFNDVKAGDVIEAYDIEEVAATID